MKKYMVIAAIMAFYLGLAGTVYADTITGKVVSVDQGGNTLTLVSESDNSSDRKEQKLVWDNDLADIQKLESANIGQTLTVNAEQNVITRSWKVKSVGGQMAAVENAFLRTDDQILSGEIVEMDRAGRSLTLRSNDNDDKGQPIQHRIVWDISSDNVLDKLDNAKVGDKITLTADQNIITKNWKAKSIAGAMQAMATGDIRLITGEVREVNSDKNFIVLYTTDSTGKSGDQKIVWDDDFKQQATLENAKIGERISVHADQNMITRNWKVSAIG